MRRFIRSGMAALTCAAAVAASSGSAEAGTITGFGSVVAFPGGFSVSVQTAPATPVIMIEPLVLSGSLITSQT